MRAIYLATGILVATFLVHVPVVSAQVLSISIGQATVVPGGFADLDVLISGGGRSLASHGYEFQIAPISGTSSQLRFIEESENFLSNSAYVYVGNSAAANDGLPSSVGTVNTTVLPDDTFIGGDSTANFGDMSVGADQLLVRLRVQHDFGPADPSTTLGHSFGLVLVPESGDSSLFLAGQSNTGFLDSQFTPIAFQSTSGLVTVTAIPEPASFSALALAAISVSPLVANRRRSRARR